MARKKRDVAAAKEAFQKERHQDQERRRQYSPVPVPASGSPPTFAPVVPEAPLPAELSRSDYRTQHLANLRTTVEAGLIPLPVDQNEDLRILHDVEPMTPHDENDDHASVPKEKSLKLRKEDYEEKMENLRRTWDKMGFHTHHPNHNAANASEDEVEEMLRAHPVLGPILKSYKIYLNTPKMRSILIQYPTRGPDQQYCDAHGNKPIELRMKPKAGIVEIDIPLDVHHKTYDRKKGVMYGRAMRNSRTLQEGGSYGLAGGFGIGDKSSKEDRRPPQSEGPSVEKLLENFDDANNKGYVMNKITLSGRIVPFVEGDPIYMVATFRGDMCTWTKLDARVSLSPQFDHVEALREQENPKPRHESAAEESPSSRYKARQKEKEAKAKEKEKVAKAINMTVKSAESSSSDSESGMYGRMKETAKIWRAIKDEPWQRLTWVDQDDDESFQVYDENLVYQDPENAPHLVSELTEEQYLDSFSAPRIVPPTVVHNVMGNEEDSTHSKEGEAEEGEAEEEESSELFDETEEEEEEEEEGAEKLPPGVVRPNDHVLRRRMEIIARAICSKPPKQHGKVENHLKKKLQGRADHRFLDPHNVHNRYYKWRLAENKAGRGYEPEDDLPKLGPGAFE